MNTTPILVWASTLLSSIFENLTSKTYVNTPQKERGRDITNESCAHEYFKMAIFSP
jgi:hypothetical protein